LSKSIGAQVFLARFLPRNAPKTLQFLVDEDLGTNDVFAVVQELKAEEWV
jgi:hypothetical protein